MKPTLGRIVLVKPNGDEERAGIIVEEATSITVHMAEGPDSIAIGIYVFPPPPFNEARTVWAAVEPERQTHAGVSWRWPPRVEVKP